LIWICGWFFQFLGLVMRAAGDVAGSGLSVYDSVYVGFAEREKADLFTSDEKQRLKGKKYISTI